MKYSKLLAVTFVALLCVGAIPLLVGSADDVAGDDTEPTKSVLDLKKGDAWGQGVQLKYKDLEPKITEIVRDIGVISDKEQLLPGLSELIKEHLIDEYTPDEFFYLFDPATTQNVVLRLDFDINEAILAEVVRADSNGYTVEVFAGISMNVNVGITIKADFIKEGVYSFEDLMDGEVEFETREAYLNLNLFTKLMVSGNLEFAKNGALRSADLAIEAALVIDLNTNLNLDIKMDLGGYLGLGDLLYGDKPDLTPTTIGLKYQNVTYGADIEAKLSAKVKASGSGIIIIPGTLDGDDQEVSVNSNLSVSDLNISAKISLTKDLERLLDGMFGDGFVNSEIYNMTIPTYGGRFFIPAVQLFKDGELNLTDFAFDLVDEVLNILKFNFNYKVSVDGDTTDGFTVDVTYQSGTKSEWDPSELVWVDIPIFVTLTIVEDFMWENIRDFEFDFLTILFDPADESIYDILETLGLTDSFTFKYLEGNEKSDVKKVVNNIKNAKKGGYASNDNVLLFAGIGIAVVAAIGVAGFMLLRKT